MSNWIALLLLGMLVIGYGISENDPSMIVGGWGLIAAPAILRDPSTPEERRARRDRRIAELEKELGL